MVNRLSAEIFLETARSVPVVDVRSPAEFAHGHIPGAHNIPLFDDLERAEVGTLYHKAGREKAVEKGMEIAGPKMKVYTDLARKLSPENEILVYCWRGGMRSESMGWLFNTAGLRASVLEKGYKGFRKHFKTSFNRPQPMIIIGGMTGSGKTRLLEQVSKSGLQTIDLESLASHKGSAFGSLGQGQQPTNEHFENLLGMAWLLLDPDKPVLLEDESLNIGRVSIPKPLYEKMQAAPLLFIDMPLEYRIGRLFKEYAHLPVPELKGQIEKIGRRLGGANAQAALQAVDEGRLKEAIRICLIYYDKAYRYDIQKRDQKNILYFKVKDEDVDSLLPEIITEYSSLTLRNDIVN